MFFEPKIFALGFATSSEIAPKAEGDTRFWVETQSCSLCRDMGPQDFIPSFQSASP